MYEGFKLVVMSLVLPPGGTLVLIALGLAVMGMWPRTGRALALVGAAVLWLCSLPVVADALVTLLGGAQPLDLASAKGADAIVILGGGVRPQAPEYGGDTLGRLTLERLRYGAYLARRTGLPVLVTGGSPQPGVRPEAELMREALESEYGVPVRWTDSRARDTRDNAANAARLLPLGEGGRRRVLLVMHGFDVRRARALFEAAGLNAIPAPTQIARWGEWTALDFLPSASALHTVHFALYEMTALARDELAAY